MNLQKRCVVSLTERIESSMWTMLGHVLRIRLVESSSAALTLVYSLDGCSANSRRGRHQINLFNTINADLALRLGVIRGYSFNCLEDLYSVDIYIKFICGY